MNTATKDDVAQPLEAGIRPLLLPEVAAKLAMGASAHLNPPEVIITFEGDAIRIHETDFELARRVAKRVKSKVPAATTRTAVLSTMLYAQQFLSEEIFKPAAARVLFYATLSEASAFYRCLMPRFALNQGTRCVAHASKGQYSRTSLEYDVVVIQIDSSPSVQQFARKLQEMGKKVIYELDDAFDALEDWHPQYASHAQPERLQSMFQMMGIADAVQVSTPWLAEWYRKHARRIEVIPNMIELAAWPKADRLRKDGLFKVVWAGSPSHSGDLREVVPALGAFARAHKDVRIVLFGQELRDTGIPEGQLELIPWCEFAEYPFRLAQIDADIAVAPLADIPFNHGKSNLRILQMWATGYPTIASNVGPYAAAISHAENGLLVDTSMDWILSLETLYGNPKMRSDLAAAGVEAVKAFDVRPNVEKIEAFYSSVAGAK